MNRKVVFVTSHPIQYQVPVFRQLAAAPGIDFEVLFAMLPDASAQGAGFGVDFAWDIPLLEGYDYSVLENVAAAPSVTRFSGCDTPGIYAILRRARPDVVVVNGWVVKTCLQTLWACLRLGIPCLVRGESNNLRTRPWWKRLIHRQLINRYAGCLYIGEANRQFYSSLGVPEERLFFSPYCIDNQLFRQAVTASVDERAALRADWGIAANAVCYVFCGKFEDKKHPLELLEAFAAAVREEGRLHLLMVGDGELKAACGAYVRMHDLPVTFSGFLNQTEIAAAYLAADCLVLPSDAGETWGLVVNEAMACGLPAIVSDRVGCALDLVIPGETGEVFRFGDWPGLSSSMVKFAGTKVNLKQMGNRAQVRVAEYSPEYAARGILKAVHNAV